ncbi:MAG: C39 family peptidase [Anaerolineales bacterium]
MTRKRLFPWLALAALVLGALAVWFYPAYRTRLIWRWEMLTTYVRGIIYPAAPVPIADPQTLETELPPTATPRPTATPLPGPTATPEPSPTPLPPSVSLKAPLYERQDINNCGPATLSMALKMYGWQGDQFAISDIIKPVPQDRNVNPDEMTFYVNNYAGWLRIITRVNGDLSLLKRLLAGGYPVIIETVDLADAPFYPNDDLWMAHYLLLTGYDDASGTFMTQDSFRGANIPVPYEALNTDWEPFNRVYMVLYFPGDEDYLSGLLGPDWDAAANRQRALEFSQQAVEEQPDNAFRWFNLGNNYLYFEQYNEAAKAFDAARNLGLPQRMLRYQFGPFIAYFHTFRTDDLLTLTEYALQRTPNSEEAMLWRGWALYRQGQKAQAVDLWQQALAARPNYPDALYALDFARANP